MRYFIGFSIIFQSCLPIFIDWTTLQHCFVFDNEINKNKWIFILLVSLRPQTVASGASPTYWCLLGGWQ